MKHLTEGKPVPLIAMFAVPMLAGNLFEMLCSTADSLIVSRVLGVNALAAMGATSSISYLIVGFAIGLAAGISIITAQRFGANDMARVRKSFGTSLVLCLVMSLLLTVVGLLCVRPLLWLLGTPAEIMAHSLAYIRVIILGIAASTFSVMLGNTLRAVGNSRAPLVFLAVSGMVNIALDILFIAGLGFGVAGAAWARVLSQLCAAAFCFIYIRVRAAALVPKREDLRVAFGEAWAHLRLGLPMGFQASVISLGTLTVQFTLNRLGPGAIAAFSAAEKINLLTLTVMNTVGLTMATYTAQNSGASQSRRIRQGVAGIGAAMLAFGLIMGVVNFLLGRRLAGLFTPGDEAVIGMIYTGLRMDALGFPILALLFLSRNVLQGLGRSAVPVIASLGELLMRCAAALVLSGWLGYLGVCMANPLAWAGAGLLITIAMVRALRRLPHG